MTRVLVSAASRHGSTTEIATAIAGVLAEGGLDARVVPPDEAEPLDGYEAAVIGSAVYAGRWLEPAKAMAVRIGEEMAGKPVWLFSSGPIGDPPMPDEVPSDAESLAARTGARDHRVFAGRLDRSGLGLAERALTAVLRAPDGDFRPWPEIRAWASGIAAALSHDPAGVGGR